MAIGGENQYDSVQRGLMRMYRTITHSSLNQSSGEEDWSVLVMIQTTNNQRIACGTGSKTFFIRS